MKISDIEEVKYDRTEEELQIFILFAIAVAGKTAQQIIKSLNKFLDLAVKNNGSNILPFKHLKLLIEQNKLDEIIAISKLGQHRKLEKAFRYLSEYNIDLRNCDVDELEKVPGVGPKTSRFFLLFNRKDVSHAVLDTHILAEMKELGYEVPKSTPQNRVKYLAIEKLFIDYARKIGRHPAKLDLEIWLRRSGNNASGNNASGNNAT